MNLDMSLLFGMILGLILGTFYATQLTTFLPLLIIASLVLVFGYFLHAK